MATSFTSDIKVSAKKHIVNSIGNSMSRSGGVLGRALGQTFKEKFGVKEDSVEDDPRVATALEEQQQIQKENNTILVRLERIVMNISDNVYNIAGVLNDQVVSMQEAKRLREEQRSRDMAAQEEAAAETQKQLAPSPSGTQPDKGEEGKKKSLLSSLVGEVGSTKKLFGKFLKKFAVFAVGIGAALGVSGLAFAGLANQFDKQDESASEVPTQLDLQPTPQNVEQTPPPPTPVAQEQDSPVSLMTSMMTRFGGEQGAKDASSVGAMLNAGASGDMGKFIDAAQTHAAANPPPPPPAPTPAAPPPSPAATTPTESKPAANPADTIKQFESNIESNNKRLADREARSKVRQEDWKKRYADDPTRLNELIEKDNSALDSYRGDIFTANKGIQQQIDALKKQPSSTVSSTASSTNVPPSSSSPSSSSQGATAVQKTPSTGSDLGTQSMNVAAAAETPPKAENNVVDTRANAAAEPLQPGGVDMPSPIANRGSLDKDTTFEAGM